MLKLEVWDTGHYTDPPAPGWFETWVNPLHVKHASPLPDDPTNTSLIVSEYKSPIRVKGKAADIALQIEYSIRRYNTPLENIYVHNTQE